MRRSFQLISLIALSMLLAGCSTRRSLDLSKSSTQLDVGVRAAKENLWREALFRFQRAVQIDPHNAMAQNNLAVAYEGIGEFEKARQAYSEALRLDRSNEYIQKNYSRFVEFYSRNRKREKRADEKDEPEKTASTAPETPAPVPTVGAPPEEPTPVPVTNPEPPTPPVSSPPVTTKPDSPPKGAVP